MWSWRRVALAAVAVVAAIAGPSLVQAQTGTISGTVTDKANKKPLEHVQVSVQGTSYGTQSKANGTYTILGVPPGTYSVQAKLVGYASMTVDNLNVSIDVNRRQDFEMSTQTAQLSGVTVTAPPVPLVEQGVVGTNATITSETISALPVTSISEVLALQQGYQEIPENTNLISLAEERRNTTQPISVRSSRGGAAITIVDGIPVNNPVFGSQAIQLNTQAVQQTNFGQGYMEPQYGGGLSGIINNSVREGGERFQGALQYQTSAVAGALGSTPDKLNAQHLFQGFISGPVPGTASKVRYMVSGQISNAAGRVLKFDDDVTRFNQPNIQPGLPNNPPQTLDVLQGWRAIGGTENNQIVGKLTFLPLASTKITLTGIEQSRQSMTYDRRYILSYGGDPWSLVGTIMDSLGLSSSRNYQNIVQGSVRDQSHLYSAQLEQRSARNYFRLSVGTTGLKRLTCNVWQGVCTADRYWLGNFTDAFIAPFTPVGFPYWERTCSTAARTTRRTTPARTSRRR